MTRWVESYILNRDPMNRHLCVRRAASIRRKARNSANLRKSNPPYSIARVPSPRETPSASLQVGIDGSLVTGSTERVGHAEPETPLSGVHLQPVDTAGVQVPDRPASSGCGMPILNPNSQSINDLDDSQLMSELGFAPWDAHLGLPSAAAWNDWATLIDQLGE